MIVLKMVREVPMEKTEEQEDTRVRVDTAATAG